MPTSNRNYPVQTLRDSLSLNDEEQTIVIIKVPETASGHKTLASLLYTKGLALAVLRRRHYEPATILTVTPQPDPKLVTIHWEDELAETRTKVQAIEFLAPFHDRRLIKSSGYKLARLSLDDATQIPAIADWQPLAAHTEIAAVFQHPQRPAHLVESRTTPQGRQYRCTCLDFYWQAKLCSTQPHLWDTMQQQPRCKHVMRVQRA